MKKILSLLFILLSFFANAQTEKDYKKVISVSELEEMLRSNKNVHLRDTYIKLDIKQEFGEQYKYGRKVTGKDAKYYEPVLDDETGECKGWRRINFNDIEFGTATFINCMFDEFVFDNCKGMAINLLENCIINKEFNINECILEGLIITNTTIKTGGFIWNCEFKDLELYSINTSNINYARACDLMILNNIIKGKIDCSGNFESVDFEKNTFHQKFSIHHSVIEGALSFYNNTFNLDSNLYYKTTGPFDDFGQPAFEGYNFFDYYPSVISINRTRARLMQFENNSFPKSSFIAEINNAYNYSITDCDVGELVFSSDTVDNLNLNGTEISSKIDFNDFVINKSISIADMEFPEYNVGFPWRMLSNKVNFYLNDSTLYQATTDEELADEKLYNSYITEYKKFFSVYKNKGDLKSSNTCYAEMKDVETRRLKYLYEHEGGIDNLLNYQLNVFLKYFAEYGTSPIKSIKISGWVILIFSFFYFFFYSDWDRINRKFLINRGEKLISYFRSEQKLEDLYSDKYKEDINTFSQFKQNLKESKTEVPFFFMLFLKPLYWVSVIKHQFNSFLYKRIEFLQGRWVDLSAGKKSLIGFATFITILTYGVYLIAVRSLNSLILSINTFTTLGFGDIPVVGVSRYVAILEGFLGWFLLSIFSVSLISQILQN